MFDFISMGLMVATIIYVLYTIIKDIKDTIKQIVVNEKKEVDPYDYILLPDPPNTLKDLYQLAKDIEGLKNLRPEYDFVEFTTKYGGTPKVYANLNLPAILSTTATSPTPTDGMFSNVPLHSGRVLIKCRKLDNVFDLDGNQIYEACTGALFIYKYRSPSLFIPYDEGVFYPPRLKEQLSFTMQEAFVRTSESIVNQLPFEDELVKLSTVNRLTEIQHLAFNQGKTYIEEPKEENSLEVR